MFLAITTVMLVGWWRYFIECPDTRNEACGYPVPGGVFAASDLRLYSTSVATKYDAVHAVTVAWMLELTTRMFCLSGPYPGYMPASPAAGVAGRQPLV